jgi:hypothetical protein
MPTVVGLVGSIKIAVVDLIQRCLMRKISGPEAIEMDVFRPTARGETQLIIDSPKRR